MSWPGWWHRGRRGRVGRRPKPVAIGGTPPVLGLEPFPMLSAEPIFLEPAELEAMRLVDMEGLTYQEAGQRMGVSRTTVWRLAKSARRKLLEAVLTGRPVVIGAPPPHGKE